MIILAMIETAEALSNVEAILAVPHLTGVYIGPMDLSLSMGHKPGIDHQSGPVALAIQTILRAAKAGGKRAGVHCVAPAFMAKAVKSGFDLVSLATDVALLKEAHRINVDEFRRLTGERPTENSSSDNSKSAY